MITFEKGKNSYATSFCKNWFELLNIFPSNIDQRLESVSITYETFYF